MNICDQSINNKRRIWKNKIKYDQDIKQWNLKKKNLSNKVMWLK